MGKRIRKIFVGDLSYIQEYEEYFSKMSKKGLHLQKVGKYFLYFKQGEPESLNYRIDVVKRDEKEAVIKKHKKEGWNFVVEKDAFLIFSSQKDSNLKELYKTPEEQKLALSSTKEELFGGKGTKIIANLIALLVVIIAIYGKIKSSNGFYLSLAKESSFLALIIIILFSFFQTKKQKNRLEKIENILDSGEFLKHQGDYSLMKRRFIVRNIILFFVIIILSYKMSQSKRVNLNKIEDLGKLPTVTISDIETMNYRHKSFAFRKNENDNTDYGNILYKDWNLLIPEENTLIETVTLYDKDQNPTKYEPCLIFDYYLTRFDFIAKGLEQDILKRENEKYSNGLYEIQKGNDFSCYGVEKENSNILLLRNGKQVIYLKYYDGTVSLEELMNIVMKKFQCKSLD